MSTDRKPTDVPAMPVPEPSSWGRIFVRPPMSPVPTLQEASDAVDEAILALEESDDRFGGEPQCFVKHQTEARWDAVGFVRPKNSERIIHRYAGMSKPTPPVDPFRIGSMADAAIRCENGMLGNGNPNPIRCEVLHCHNGGETSLVVTTGPRRTPLAPWHEQPMLRARILMEHVRSCLRSYIDHGDASEDFIADAECQAIHILSLCDASQIGRRPQIITTGGSPISRPGVRVTWSRLDADPFAGGRRALVLPDAVQVMMSRTSDRLSINIAAAVHAVPVSNIDAMTVLRGHARIRERGYVEAEA